MQVVDPTRTAFFLDVDGTLLGFKDDPSHVVADARLLEILTRLESRSRGAVAFVSGRAVADLDRIMAPLVLPAGGVHGADLRFPDGGREAVAGTALDEVKGAIQAFVSQHRGLRIEDKGVALALHYRQAPALRKTVVAFLEGRVTHPDLKVQHGKMVAEVKPEGADKGTAIAALMRHAPFAGRVPLFVGDDLTDEFGFAAVNAMHGISIKVGDPHEETVATHRLGSPAAVLDFLAQVAA